MGSGCISVCGSHTRLCCLYPLQVLKGNLSSRKDIAVIGLNIIHGLNIYPRQLCDGGKTKIMNKMRGSLRTYEHVVLMANWSRSSVT